MTPAQEKFEDVRKHIKHENNAKHTNTNVQLENKIGEEKGVDLGITLEWAGLRILLSF